MGTCGECEHYTDECQLMAEASNALCLVKTSADTPCPIGKFVARELELEEPSEIIGLREFARLVGVKLASIQDAIEAGRITAVVQTRNGRKLQRADALVQWKASRSAHNSNRFGELEGDLDGLEVGEGDASGLMSPDGLPWGARKTKEEALLAEQRRLKIELERMELEGMLHRAEDVEAVLADVMVRFRTKCLSLPAKLAPIIAAMGKPDAMKVQAEIERGIREVLTELSQYDPQLVKAHAKKRQSR